MTRCGNIPAQAGFEPRISRSSGGRLNEAIVQVPWRLRQTERSTNTQTLPSPDRQTNVQKLRITLVYHDTLHLPKDDASLAPPPLPPHTSRIPCTTPSTSSHKSHPLHHILYLLTQAASLAPHPLPPLTSHIPCTTSSTSSHKPHPLHHILYLLTHKPHPLHPHPLPPLTSRIPCTTSSTSSHKPHPLHHILYLLSQAASLQPHPLPPLTQAASLQPHPPSPHRTQILCTTPSASSHKLHPLHVT